MEDRAYEPDYAIPDHILQHIKSKDGAKDIIGAFELYTKSVVAEEAGDETRAKFQNLLLCHAVEEEHDKLIELLLKDESIIKGALPLDHNKHKLYAVPIVIALHKGNKKVVEFLLEKNVNISSEGIQRVSKPDSEYGTINVIQLAIQNQDIDILNIFLAFFNQRICKLCYQDNVEVNAVCQLIYFAMMRPPVGLLESAQWSQLQHHALHLACLSKSVANLKMMLETGECNVDAYGMFRSTPLMQACVLGLEFAELLLSHGASVNYKNEDGHTCLIRAIGTPKCIFISNIYQEHATQIVAHLLKVGADVNIETGSGHSALCSIYLQIHTPLEWLLDEEKQDTDLGKHHDDVMNCVKLLLKKLTPTLKPYKFTFLNDALDQLSICMNYVHKDIISHQVLVPFLMHGVYLYKDILVELLKHGANSRLQPEGETSAFDSCLQQLYNLDLTVKHYFCELRFNFHVDKYKEFLLEIVHLYMSHGWALENKDKLASLLKNEPTFYADVFDAVMEYSDTQTFRKFLFLLQQAVTVESEHNCELGGNLNKYTMAPRSLKELSRLTIYLALNRLTAVNTKKLPLPIALKNYICRISYY